MATPAQSDQKRLSTLQARAALGGIVVHVMKTSAGGEEYVATRWNLTKTLTSLDQLQAWLDRVGAPAA